MFRSLLGLACALISFPFAMAQSNSRWTALYLPSGTGIEYPSGIFRSRHTRSDSQPVYSRNDGDASFSLFDERKSSSLSLERAANQAADIPISYRRVTPTFFVLSGARRGAIFYRRCNVSGGTHLACFDLAYPQTERKQWDNIVTRMSRSLRSGGR